MTLSDDMTCFFQVCSTTVQSHADMLSKRNASYSYSRVLYGSTPGFKEHRAQVEHDDHFAVCFHGGSHCSMFSHWICVRY